MNPKEDELFSPPTEKQCKIIEKRIEVDSTQCHLVVKGMQRSCPNSFRLLTNSFNSAVEVRYVIINFEEGHIVSFNTKEDLEDVLSFLPNPPKVRIGGQDVLIERK